jgi:hypothetical protein
MTKPSTRVAVVFRKGLERWLALPRKTPLGEILREKVSNSFGTPSGSHQETLCWVYKRNNSLLRMDLAFYSNFTDDDLICKVSTDGINKGDGATIQFNSGRCVSEKKGLTHHGNVTVRKRLKRTDLFQLIEQNAADGLDFITTLHGSKSWPIILGSLNNIGELIDQIFAYAYCIEQAKRAHRKESPLPQINSKIPAKIGRIRSSNNSENTPEDSNEERKGSQKPSTDSIYDDVLEDPPLPRTSIEMKTRNLTGEKKKDYIQEALNNKSIGDAGEKWILELEREKLIQVGKESLANKIKWVSREDGDSLGYDILSYDDIDECPIYIEVKTTSSGKKQPFYLTENELRFAEENGNAQYCIYRVFDFSIENKTGKLFILSLEELKKYNLIPSIYKVIL